MRVLRFQPREQAASGDTPEAACRRTIESVRQKANRNEVMARWSTGLIILASALIPVSIILSTRYDEFLWGKVLPAAFAAIAGAVAGLLQVERPHDRWRLYRGYQRLFEAELLRYENGAPPYDLAPDERRSRFAETVAGLQLRLHNDWSGLVPVRPEGARPESTGAIR